VEVREVKEEVLKEFVGKRVDGFEQCFRCGACSGVCPVKRSTGVFDPRKIVHSLLLGFKEKVLNEVLWYCSQCGSCVPVCPMEVKPKEVISALREYMLEKGLIDRDRLFELGIFARVNPEKCIVCLTCVRVCPFGAVSIKEEVAVIDPEKCRGCGICTRECPARAIEIKTRPEYTEEEF
jgi:heterodisulfide reductase subunit C